MAQLADWPPESMRRQAFTILILLAGVAALVTAQSNPTPIPQQPEARPVAPFVGQPAVARPVAATLIPQNPFMMAGSWSNIHGDSYMSDTYFTGGPLGRSPQVLSTFLGTPTASGLPVVMVFGRDQRLLAGITRVDIVDGSVRSYLVLIDPTTLRTLAALPLPSSPAREGRSFRPAGAYFYLDQFDRIVVGRQLSAPGPITFLQTQRIDRVVAGVHQSEFVSGADQCIVGER